MKLARCSLLTGSCSGIIPVAPRFTAVGQYSASSLRVASVRNQAVSDKLRLVQCAQDPSLSKEDGRLSMLQEVINLEAASEVYPLPDDLRHALSQLEAHSTVGFSVIEFRVQVCVVRA